MNASIKALNQKLGDSLGYVRSGTQPRWAWKWAPDLPYWRTRLGAVWVLCQWTSPFFTEQQWQQQFRGRYPYPAQGMYHAHPETVLSPGRVPTLELTQNYIWALDRQMSTSFTTQVCDSENAVQAHRENDYIEWVDYVQDSNPAFSNFEPGNRGGHVSYGGI
jgi:hypothetical protein